MKILDVDLFQEGLQRNITMVDRLSGEMKAIHQAVKGLVQMEDQLKGVGGNAIRSFYEECHLPFLHFFQLFSEQFKQVLNQMEASLHSLEPDSSGYILETFLDGELEQGLTLIGELTASLTDEANSIMNQVSDIVALPHLDDSGVQEGVISSKRKRNDTLMQLYEFDAIQTYALNPIEQGLQTMDTWLTDMEGLFQAGVKDINFLPSQWDVLTFRSNIRTELFSKVYLNPNDLWVKEQEQLIGTMITAATFQTMEGKKVKTIEENVAENIKYHAYDNGLLIKEYVVGQTVFYEVVSKVDYKEEAITVEKPKENKFLDSLQFGLDIAGLIPVVGEIADGANGLIYTAKGDMLNAGLSFSAMIPVVGVASTGGKLAVKGSKAVEEAQDASKAVDNVKDGAEGSEVSGKGVNGTGWTEVKSYPADNANTWWKDNMGYENSPYKPGTVVSEVQLVKETKFVRVYDGDISGQFGGWLMKAEDVAGQTPKQIRDKFALPAVPKYITDVNVPVDTVLRKGIVNPLDGWGSGGGVQFDLMGQRIGEFTNPRLLP